MSASSESTGGGGPRRTSVRRAQLPDVCGLLLDDARVVLERAGFLRSRVHYVESYDPDFTVVEMQPGSGILLDKDREIVLRVSRSNLVQFLPQVFQQTADADGSSFLKGFLYILQSVYDSIGKQLDKGHQLYDPRTTHEEFLPWLAGWMSITLNRDWTTLQTRKMLLAATRLFPYRGTARAIAEFVRIYAGAKVVVEENSWPFKGFRVGVHSTVGEDTVILPNMNLAFCFVVRLDRPASEVPEEEIIRIHEIIQLQKPAHTSYFLAFSDESATGEMGVLMTIGDSAIGVGGGIGIGVGVAEPAAE